MTMRKSWKKTKTHRFIFVTNRNENFWKTFFDSTFVCVLNKSFPCHFQVLLPFQIKFAFSNWNDCRSNKRLYYISLTIVGLIGNLLLLFDWELALSSHNWNGTKTPFIAQLSLGKFATVMQIFFFMLLLSLPQSPLSVGNGIGINLVWWNLLNKARLFIFFYDN